MTKFLKALSIFVILTVGAPQVKAQYVTIPDTNFVNWLNSNGFSSCMIGNQMDTTSSLLLSANSIDCSMSNIHDLTGIQYFKNLIDLKCQYNLIDSLKNLPDSLLTLECQGNQMSYISYFPSNLTSIECNNNQLTVLPVLPANLNRIYCWINPLTSLPALPSSLIDLRSANCLLTSLPILPSYMNYLSIDHNLLTSLNNLPDTVSTLDCSFNQIDSLPTLPFGMEVFWCNNNLLTIIPALPSTLTQLNCNNNMITQLPTLPPPLKSLSSYNNQLINLPTLPDSMIDLRISGNLGITCLPPIRHIDQFYFSITGITCMPSVLSVGISYPNIDTIPVCDIINLYNCPIDWNIKGDIFSDINSDCIKDTLENLDANIKLQLFENGSLIQQTFSNGLGQYTFNVDTGIYQYSIDTTVVPFFVDCPLNLQHISNISPLNLFENDKDFSIQCKPGFDVGVSTVKLDSGNFRPSNVAEIAILAGDLSNLYNLNCASGIGGNLRVIINGPANFVNAASGSLIPFVSGDTLIYSIPDFGAVNFYNDFRFLVQTDTLAQLNDQVCFNILVTPVAGDNNQANNYYSHCFTVVNSYDPNDKQVSPSGLTDTSLYDLTYTIRFQNTGNAPAQHIYVLDTLDQNIDESSFQLLTYSHEPQMQIIGKRVRFNFPNINLPDSVNNEPESHGFVQYRVKRKNNLPIGTQIHNTAYIYFDFNPPVQTNTTTNEIAVTSGVGVGEYQNPIQFSIFPNPVSSGQLHNIYFNSSEKKKAELNVYDLSGRKLFSQFVNASEQSQVVTLPSFSPGVYLVILNDGKQQMQQKLVVLKNSN